MTKLTEKARLATENAALKRKLMEMEAQLASTYHFAQAGIKGATRAKTMGSGVLVQLHYNGGKEVCPPFMLKDGLSDELIDALGVDLLHSYDLAVLFKPHVKGNPS